MSFYDITDHKKRDEIVKDYLATMKRIKKRNMDEKLENLGYQIQMQEKFKPVLESNAEMAKEITQDLVPIRQELETLNKTIRKRQLLPSLEMGSPRRLPELPYTPLRPRSTSEPQQRIGKTAAEYLKKTLNEGNDAAMGIRYQGHDMMIGDKKIELQDDNNLKVGDKIYDGTPGLWSLITEKKPKEYTLQDQEAYKDLLIQTNAIYHNNDPASGRAKSSKSSKWKTIIAPIWEELKNKKGGDGIVVFLPKDIKGLWQKLKLLGAEYRAGNKTTHNELVAVLDELKRQGGITEEEYTDINSSL